MKEWVNDRLVETNFLDAIRSGVIDKGRELARTQGGNAQTIACAVTENSLLIGGATGRTEFQRLFVGFLWIGQQWRGIGLGAETLHRIEALAAERGCVDSIIETMDDGIAKWYQRTGYAIIAQVPGYCGPWTRHTLVKSLTV